MRSRNGFRLFNLAHGIGKFRTSPQVNWSAKAYLLSHSSTFACNYSSSSKAVEFIPLQKMTASATKKFIAGSEAIDEYPFGPHLPASLWQKPHQIFIEDVVPEEKQYGQIQCITSDKEAKVEYGKAGIAASKNTSPAALLKESMPIPANTRGILKVKSHVPFRIRAKPALSSFQGWNNLMPVYEHKKNISRYSFETIGDLQGHSKLVSMLLQAKIHFSKENEPFYEETTLKVYGPSFDNRSSGTLMDFSSDAKGTTDTHWHPGERALLIVTTHKDAGATLNFCGINEDPNERKDSEVVIDFPKHAISVLQFPAGTHHKFSGDFVCLSVHPREGQTFIQTLQSGGQLPSGFLESATVFSKGTKKWTERVAESSTQTEQKQYTRG